MVKITLPDKSVKEFKAGVTPQEVAASIGKRLAADALAAKVDGKLVDVFVPIEKDCSLEIVTFSSPDGKHVFWHSAAHVLAYAIKNLYPDAKNTIGPAIEQGFFYDFDSEAYLVVSLLTLPESFREGVRRMKPCCEADITTAI